jgi:iron-sulfur cluster assembly accessory protein
MHLTPGAVAQIRSLLDQPEPKLIKVGVRNRGCSGLAYHLEYVERPGAFDEEVEQDGVKVLIDSKALFSIIGSEMDWVEDKLNQRFVFRNPNISTYHTLTGRINQADGGQRNNADAANLSWCDERAHLSKHTLSLVSAALALGGRYGIQHEPPRELLDGQMTMMKEIKRRRDHEIYIGDCAHHSPRTCGRSCVISPREAASHSYL